MFLGIDIGGTKILAYVVGPSGGVVAKSKKRLKDPEPEAVLERAHKTAEEALSAADVGPKKLKRVGIAVPSAVVEGVARLAPALGWRDVPVQKFAEGLFDRPVFVANDVALGTAAEFRETAPHDKATVVAFSMGTGVGGALIHEGVLVTGTKGLAGELGHMVVVTGGRPCGCGGQGCLEAYSSKTAFVHEIERLVREEGRETMLKFELDARPGSLKSSALKAAHDAGDELVREVVDEGLRHLGAAAATMINIADPDLVILGGGVVESFGLPLAEKVQEYAKPYVYGERERVRRIVPSRLGDDAVPLGAAFLAYAKGRIL